MTNILSYKDLLVWKKSMDLVTKIYDVTCNFPDNEQYGLVNQMRRSAVSIPSNIAEGFLRGSRKDYARFIRIAFGSSGELETQIEISRRLKYISWEDAKEISNQLKEIMRMLNGLRGKLTTKA